MNQIKIIAILYLITGFIISGCTVESTPGLSSVPGLEQIFRGKKSILITSSPPGAKVSFMGKELGETPLSTEICADEVIGKGGKATLLSWVVQKQGYKSTTKTMSFGNIEEVPKHIHLALKKIDDEDTISAPAYAARKKMKEPRLGLVDIDTPPKKIPGFENKNSYAIVIGISKYREEIIPPVRYAKRDAEIVAQYLQNIGGVPRRNIKILTNEKATRADIEGYVKEWLPRRSKKDSRVFIYYAGHGAPDPKTGKAYLVPYEGHPDFASRLYPLEQIYAALGKLPAKEIVVMLDACFSGAGGRSVSQSGGRPMTISIEDPVLASDKITVLAAATGSQISSDYDSKRHGLFTYYLLKGMGGAADSNGDGIISLDELYPYVADQVFEKASVELNRDQTPEILPSMDQLKERSKMPIARVR